MIFFPFAPHISEVFRIWIWEIWSLYFATLHSRLVTYFATREEAGNFSKKRAVAQTSASAVFSLPRKEEAQTKERVNKARRRKKKLKKKGEKARSGRGCAPRDDTWRRCNGAPHCCTDEGTLHASADLCGTCNQRQGRQGITSTCVYFYSLVLSTLYFFKNQATLFSKFCRV